jgi:hypothetical protein
MRGRKSADMNCVERVGLPAYVKHVSAALPRRICSNLPMIDNRSAITAVAQDPDCHYDGGLIIASIISAGWWLCFNHS